MGAESDDGRVAAKPGGFGLAAQTGQAAAFRGGGVAAHGQAMVEFAVALFAVVVLVTGITEFIGLAGRRGDLFAEVRGKAGKRAAEHAVADARPPAPPEMPVVETSGAALARCLQREKKEEKVALSKAMRKWVFDNRVDHLAVRGEVWMPSMGLGGAGGE